MPARGPAPGRKARGAAPRPRLLGERHVRGVEQELLPPVGAHQSHRLLIQPDLHQQERLRKPGGGRGRRGRAEPGFCPRREQVSSRSAAHVKIRASWVPAEVPFEDRSPLTVSASSTHWPKHTPGTRTPHRDARDTPVASEVRSHPQTHRNVVQLVVGHSLLHHVRLLRCPWHRHNEPCDGEGTTKDPSAAQIWATAQPSRGICEPSCIAGSMQPQGTCPTASQGTRQPELPTVAATAPGDSRGLAGKALGALIYDQARLPPRGWARRPGGGIPFRMRYT